MCVAAEGDSKKPWGGLGRAGKIRKQQQQKLRDQPRGCRRSCLAGRRGGEGCSNSSPLSWAPGVAQRQQRAQLPACRQLQRRKRGVTSKAEGEGEGGGGRRKSRVTFGALQQLGAKVHEQLLHALVRSG